MKERPIIMTGESVRAILDGRKTQTRRIYRTRPQDHIDDPNGPLWALPSPYGSPGERLWVKETWCLAHPDYHTEDEGESLGRPMRDGRWCHYAECDDVDGDDGRSPWRSPLFMPRWVSRLTLEVAEVRVQRLQDISEDDAIAEGMVSDAMLEQAGAFRHGKPLPSRPEATARMEYAGLWDEINAKRRRRVEVMLGDPGYKPQRPWRTVVDTSAAWESNPWVWAITFARVP